jgi:hypothetical protein
MPEETRGTGWSSDLRNPVKLRPPAAGSVSTAAVCYLMAIP